MHDHTENRLASAQRSNDPVLKILLQRVHKALGVENVQELCSVVESADSEVQLLVQVCLIDHIVNDCRELYP